MLFLIILIILIFSYFFEIYIYLVQLMKQKDSFNIFIDIWTNSTY